MRESVVELTGVSVTYHSGSPWARVTTEAVRELTLSIGAGETVGLVGESGSGKSTVGRVCVGLLRPQAGDVRFRGERLDTSSTHRGLVQAVFQHPDWSLNPRLHVATSVAEPLTVIGEGTRRERRDRARAMLELVGLAPSLGGRYPHELSGGQRQRVAIARALVTRPRFILFDEVVTALDVSVQAQILNLLADLQREQSFGALFISHDLAVVRYIAHRIGVLYAGELVEMATAERFYGQPDHEYSRQLRAAIDTDVS